VSLDLQPASDDLAMITSYYAILKANKSCHKHVRWLVIKPDVAVSEYQGTPPSMNAEHELARKNQVKFVQSKPAALKKI